MNSEELELSLRNEFESCLKDKLAELKQEVVLFQEKVEAEFEKHKSQIDEVFRDFSARISADKPLEAGFSETVVEHLRLARDEGSKVAVAAMEKAEAMQAEAEPIAPKAGISELSLAINDISSKTTQSSILKTLVHHAGQFTPRGAFFIIKNEHLVGWRVFGNEGNADEQTVREVFFPVAAETVLGESVRSLSAVESSYGSYADDLIYLNKLDFGHPDRMFAMPLVVRGRSVAVLYADNGSEGEEVNAEALETLARVASMTVEVLASARVAKISEEVEKPQETHESGSLDSGYVETAQAETESPEAEVQEDEAQAGFVMAPTEEVEEISAEETVEQVEEAETPTVEMADSEESVEMAEISEESAEEIEEPQAEEIEELQAEETETTSFEMVETSEEAESSFEMVETSDEIEEVEEPQAEVQEELASAEVEEVEEVAEEANYYEPVAETPVSTEDYATPTVGSYEFETNYQTETAQSFEPVEAKTEAETVETPQFESTGFEFATPQTVEEPSPVQSDFDSYEVESFKAETPVAETVEAVSEPAPTVSEAVVSTPPTRSRFSDRNVDLPIEVGEDERRLHNDARRFARLLVSEIKLYNEQKVKEGRDASDLYERLREAIDRSREMYDKRVQPPVAARFDYFHYEVVSTLAEGDEHKLGGSYPGAHV